MSMYFCHYTFEASQHPKFLNEAIRLLTDARNKVFLDSNDVEVLEFKVREALDAAKPKGSTAQVYKHVSDQGDIQLRIYQEKGIDYSVGRAYFAPVRAITTYDLDEEQFIEVKLKMEEQS